MRVKIPAIAVLVIAISLGLGLSGAQAGPKPGSRPLQIQMFTVQLPIPPEIDARAGGAFGIDEISATHVFGKLTSGQWMPPTPSFGYWPSTLPLPADAYLGPTIEAQRGKPIAMTVTNDLYRVGAGPTDPNAPQIAKQLHLDVIHPLAAYFDQTIEGTEMLNQYAPATSTHLHGAHAYAASDGLPMDTYRAAIIGDTSDYAHGTGAYAYQYPNDQEATNLWYHDHAVADTRFNPMAGLAGFYFIRDSWDTGDPDNPLGLPANSRFHVLGSDGGFPVQVAVNPLAPNDPTRSPWEVPLVLQDRSFNPDGTLSYPTMTTTFHPIWAPESFNDVATVNGVAWPNLNVDRGVYRFRVLNGSNARFYSLKLVDAASGKQASIPVYQIGSDGGLLNAPVPIKSLPGEQLLIAPGERFDLLVDFRNAAAGATYRWMNNASAPYPFGSNDLKSIMQFTVGNDAGFTGPIPTVLRGQSEGHPLISSAKASMATAPGRTVFLNEVEDLATGDPEVVLLNNLNFMDATDHMRTSGIEKPKVNTVEVWTVVNTTGDAHPIHLHAVQFRLIDRQKIDAAGYLAAVNPLLPAPPFIDEPEVTGTGVMGSFGAISPPDPTPYLRGNPKGPDDNETGWQDTIKVYPGEVARILVPFGGTAAGIVAPFTGEAKDAPVQHFTGTYVWHCHILEHEENDMMLPYQITP